MKTYEIILKQYLNLFNRVNISNFNYRNFNNLQNIDNMLVAFGAVSAYRNTP